MIHHISRVSEHALMHPAMRRTLKELRVYMWATTALVSITALSLMYLSLVHGV
jgi:hypothetical protein